MDLNLARRSCGEGLNPPFRGASVRRSSLLDSVPASRQRVLVPMVPQEPYRLGTLSGSVWSTHANAIRNTAWGRERAGVDVGFNTFPLGSGPAEIHPEQPFR